MSARYNAMMKVNGICVKFEEGKQGKLKQTQEAPDQWLVEGRRILFVVDFLFFGVFQ